MTGNETVDGSICRVLIGSWQLCHFDKLIEPRVLTTEKDQKQKVFTHEREQKQHDLQDMANNSFVSDQFFT